MAEVGFRDRQNRLRVRLTTNRVLRPREDASPDSVIFTNGSNSNFSLFSSASASASGDRCSFASDHESLVSEPSQHLAGHDLAEGSSGPDPDPTKLPLRLTRKAEKVTKVPKEGLGLGLGSESVTEDEAHPPDDSATTSFSLALKDCQEWRFRSTNALLLSSHNKPDRRRPASLDLNNVTASSSSSPRLAAAAAPPTTMKKTPAAASRRTGTTGLFPSPGTPNYRHNSVGVHKGWASERVPSHAASTRRHLATSAALLPFNNGRTLPSKWEDAERWIFSPVSGGGFLRPAAPPPPPQRRPKSKSGPLGPPGAAGCYSMYSPVMPMFEGTNFTANSPFSPADGTGRLFGLRREGGGAPRDFPVHDEPCIARSTSMHDGCTNLLGQSSMQGSGSGSGSGSTDEKPDDIKDADTHNSYALSRRDMATQMSPEGSTHTSPRSRLSFSHLNPSAIPIEENLHSSGVEVRDVQVDERVTVTRWSKKNRRRPPRRDSGNTDVLENKAFDAHCPAWNLPETERNVSRVEREEAKITAWEIMQKAKAEAAIQKLEMKLEKKRTSSMDKILNKLRSAQKRAQEMRTSVLADQTNQVAETSHKHLSFSGPRHIGSLSGCFNCHAFQCFNY